MYKRILAMLLAVCMMISAVPMAVFAEETGTDSGINEVTDTGNTTAGEGEGGTEVKETAAYTVEHHVQTADGYELKEFETLEGIIGAATEAAAKTYEGFEAKAFEQAIIAAEGTTVVAIYYDVKAAEEVPTTAAYTVEHYLQAADGYELKEFETLEGTIGAATEAAAKTYEGFEAKAFEQAIIAAEGTTVVAIYYDVKAAEEAPTTAAYTVEHYVQTADGYELKEFETLEGTIGAATEAAAKVYEGYTAKAFEQGTIAADGSTVVVIEYDAVPVEIEEEDKFTMDDVVTVVSDKKSTLAPGITLNELLVYDKNGDRVEIYVATADLSVETVGVYATYKDDQNDNYGMSKLTEQVAAVEAKNAEPFSVVSGINASYYNMVNGKPLGAFVMKGNDVTTQKANGTWEGDDYAFFAILKDGTPMIGDKGEYSKYRGQIQEAVQGHIHLINDGKIVAGLDAKTKYPRQTIGITADGEVITMTADGNQAPKSIGLTIQEQAEVMLALGCVEAVHMDGGGSCTYGARPEGADTFRVISSPSDGSERSVSNSLIFVSTAVADGTFDHAVLTAENDYVTPGSTVTVSAVGVDAAGSAAEIPETAQWKMAEETMGTVVDGIYTAAQGYTGQAVVQLVVGENVVGTATVNVVVPDTIMFDTETITVPYGKQIPLNVSATYGVNEVALKEGDVVFTLENSAMGTIEGFNFTAAADETVAGGKITVALTANDQVKAEANMVFGKGSEVLMDFEDNDLGEMYITTGYPQYGPKGNAKDENGNYYYNGQNELGELSIVTAENGKVHNGDYALAVECDFTQPYETGYHMLSMQGFSIEVPANAQTIGMWIHIPELEELVATSIRLCGVASDGAKITSPYLWENCAPYGWSNDGWRYVTMDLSGYNKDIEFYYMQLYICDRDSSDVNYYFKDHASVNSKFTYYIDDITVDYSSAVDDREAPVFSNLYYSVDGMSDSAALNGQTVTNNVVSFSASVSEDTKKSNYTGIDADSVRGYVDGVAVGAAYSGGIISMGNQTLADGVHTIRFEIADNMGNMSYIQRQITVNAGSDMPTVSLVPQKPDASKILIGSLYWMNLETADAATVEKVTMELNLNSVSQWELNHMVVTPGFEGSYSIDSVTNNATVTITKTGTVEDGVTVLAQLPIRTWESRLTEYEGYEDQTPAKLWSRKIIWPMDIKLSMNYGQITFADGTSGSFSMAPIAVITELYGNYGEMNAAGDYTNKPSWHIHTAEKLADKAPTCTEAGYSNRTFCKVCDSVVSWGTTVAAKDHSFEHVDGVLKCVCGELFNGVYTDGKTYVDGVAKADGWEGDSYYLNGAKLTGVQKVPAPDASGEFYYDFGEEGICAGKVKFTGIFSENDKNYLSKVGVLTDGWYLADDGCWYYFLPETMEGADGKVTTTDNITFDFENGKVLSGVWTTDGKYRFYWYGPDYYKSNSKNVEFLIVEIDGDTYLFNSGGVMQTGLKFTHESGNPLSICYDCGTDGKAKPYNGVINDILYVDAYQQTAYKLVKLGSDFYFVSDGHKIAKNTTQYLGGSVAGHTYDDGTPLEPGYYDFGPDGKMVVRNGVYGDYVYINNIRQTCYKLVKVNGDFYFINDGHKIARNTTVYLGGSVKGHTFDDGTPLEPGYYDFNEEGKMVVRNGVYGDYLYINNVRQTCYKLMKYDGDFYFINDGHKIARNTTVYLGGSVQGHTFADGTPLEPGYYDFNEEGKMVVRNGVYGDYLYINNVRQTCYKLVEFDGELYFINDGHKIARNTTMYLSGSLNGHTYQGIKLEPGLYDFDADGKMVLRNGVYDDYLYINNVRQTCYKLVKYNGDYYFINDGHKIARSTKIYMSGSLKGHTDANGNPLQPGYYEFDADGKMILP